MGPLVSPSALLLVQGQRTVRPRSRRGPLGDLDYNVLTCRARIEPLHWEMSGVPACNDRNVRDYQWGSEQCRLRELGVCSYLNIIVSISSAVTPFRRLICSAIDSRGPSNWASFNTPFEIAGA